MPRADILKTGLQQAIHGLKLFYPEDDPEQISTFVKNTFNQRFQPPTFTIIADAHLANPKVKKIGIKELIKGTKDTMVSPFGAVYQPPEENEAFVSQYLEKNINDRNKYKDLMYYHSSVGNIMAEIQCNLRQGKVKIANNSVIGAKGSPYNCFYDLPGFNAITGAARTLIKTSYSVAEQTLEGNFHWVDQDDLLNFINLHLSNMPHIKKVRLVIDQFQLYEPTKAELLDFYYRTMLIYEAGPSSDDRTKYSMLDLEKLDPVHRRLLESSDFLKPADQVVDLKIVKRMLDHLEQEQITYLFYVQNLAHLFFNNSTYFKQLISSVMDTSTVTITPGKYQPNDVFKFNEAFIPVLSLAYLDLLYGAKLKDYIEANPEHGIMFASFLGRLSDTMETLNSVFYTFILTPVAITRVNEKDKYWRKTVIESDTDSVIFEIMNWIEWYCGNGFDDSPRSYQIIAFSVFLLSKVTDHYMRIYCRQLGAKTERQETLMIMKNEYWYPFMIVYEIKKTYAGVMLIKEGNVLKKPKLDIKGVNLKGSTFPGIVQKFVEDRVVSIKPGLKIRELIDTTCSIERDIFKDLVAGQFNYLKVTPVRLLKDYINDQAAEKTSYFYYRFWQEVFAPKYGDLALPGKFYNIPLLSFTDTAVDQITQIDKAVGERLKKFLANNKNPNFIVINNLLKSVPEELIVVMDIRKIITSVVKPFYITLRQFAVPVWFESKDFLLSDIYTE
jgi:hypothetical protein